MCVGRDEDEGVVPVLWAVVWICVAMLAMLFAEAVFLATVSLWVKVAGRIPEKMYRWEPIGKREDLEEGEGDHPMVFVQIPMYNEKEICKLSIGAACALTWPPDRIVIQVLDDSTDPHIKVRQMDGEGSSSTQPLVQQQQLVPVQDTYKQSRAEALQNVESTIHELSSIFTQLATMVSQQGELAIRIDENMDDTLANVEGAQGALLKHLNSISSNRWLMIKIFFVLVIFLMIFLFFVA